MRRLGFLLYLLAATSAAQDVIVERDIMIPMRDGVRLAADVYRPAVDGVAIAEPLPLLLSRSPYSKSRECDVLAATHFARHGYVAVVQDMRGRYASEGEFTKYAVVETEDGFDTVEWLANKAYSNGQVGMWGTSYSAHTASDAAKLAPPALKAILLNEGGMANAWDHAVRHGSAFELGRELHGSPAHLVGRALGKAQGNGFHGLHDEGGWRGRRRPFRDRGPGEDAARAIE